MVLLTATPQILSAISSLSYSDRSRLNALPTCPGAPIEHKTIIAISRRAHGFSLNSLLRGTKVYVPPPPPKQPPSPEYVALMERLRKEQEQREYAALLSKPGAEGGGEAFDDKDDITPSLVLNILLSIVMCGAAVFYMTRYWPNDGLRVLVSFLVAIVVGVAEVTVFAAYLRKVKMSKEKEKAKREKKVFLGEYRDDPQRPRLSSSSVGGEKEEIWGRGINGGMRRRVREKWHKAQHGESGATER